MFFWSLSAFDILLDNEIEYGAEWINDNRLDIVIIHFKFNV